MKLGIVAVSHRQPAWVQEGCEEYLKRMPRELPLSVMEVKPEPRGARTRAQLQAAERGRIEAWITPASRVVVLDEKGKDLSTRMLAGRLEFWMREGRDTLFLIGGADGLDAGLKERADEMIRLSSLTLPHGMARLVLCEQVYRAWSLLKNHPYHRE